MWYTHDLKAKSALLRAPCNKLISYALDWKINTLHSRIVLSTDVCQSLADTTVIEKNA